MFKGITSSKKELPDKDTFKRLGSRLVDEMKRPYLASFNIRNLKYFNEVYGIETGDILIEMMVDWFYVQCDVSTLGTMTYSDHMLTLCDAGGLTVAEVVDYYNSISDEFLQRVHAHYGRAKIQVECGIYMMQPGDDFIYAQDNARIARRSTDANYGRVVGLYTEDLRDATFSEARIIPDFQTALENNGIKVLLQPKFSTSEDKIVGAEALSRFANSKGEIISPAVYVPVLERAGLISQLDLEVLSQSINLLKKWKEAGLPLFPISINLSRLDVMEDSTMAKVDQMIDDADLDPCLLEFELTETVLTKNLELVVERLKHLRQKGYRIALDDFGSGYNSLYVLGCVEANVIKFDRGFVIHSIQNEKGMTILRNMINTFKEVKFEVLCEGIETDEERQKIVDCGCEVIQGFFYDKPLEISDFEEKYIYA